MQLTYVMIRCVMYILKSEASVCATVRTQSTITATF